MQGRAEYVKQYLRDARSKFQTADNSTGQKKTEFLEQINCKGKKG
jgi:hypothetical protein